MLPSRIIDHVLVVFVSTHVCPNELTKLERIISIGIHVRDYTPPAAPGSSGCLEVTNHAINLQERWG